MDHAHAAPLIRVRGRRSRAGTGRTTTRFARWPAARCVTSASSAAAPRSRRSSSARSRKACRPTGCARVHAPVGLDIGAVTPEGDRGQHPRGARGRAPRQDRGTPPSPPCRCSGPRRRSGNERAEQSLSRWLEASAPGGEDVTEVATREPRPPIQQPADRWTRRSGSCSAVHLDPVSAASACARSRPGRASTCSSGRCSRPRSSGSCARVTAEEKTPAGTPKTVEAGLDRPRSRSVVRRAGLPLPPQGEPRTKKARPAMLRGWPRALRAGPSSRPSWAPKNSRSGSVRCARRPVCCRATCSSASWPTRPSGTTRSGWRCCRRSRASRSTRSRCIGRDTSMRRRSSACAGSGGSRPTPVFSASGPDTSRCCTGWPTRSTASSPATCTTSAGAAPWPVRVTRQS